MNASEISSTHHPHDMPYEVQFIFKINTPPCVKLKSSDSQPCNIDQPPIAVEQPMVLFVDERYVLYNQKSQSKQSAIDIQYFKQEKTVRIQENPIFSNYYTLLTKDLEILNRTKTNIELNVQKINTQQAQKQEEKQYFHDLQQDIRAHQILLTACTVFMLLATGIALSTLPGCHLEKLLKGPRWDLWPIRALAILLGIGAVGGNLFLLFGIHQEAQKYQIKSWQLLLPSTERQLQLEHQNRLNLVEEDIKNCQLQFQLACSAVDFHYFQIITHSQDFFKHYHQKTMQIDRMRYTKFLMRYSTSFWIHNSKQQFDQLVLLCNEILQWMVELKKKHGITCSDLSVKQNALKDLIQMQTQLQEPSAMYACYEEMAYHAHGLKTLICKMQMLESDLDLEVDDTSSDETVIEKSDITHQAAVQGNEDLLHV